MTYTASVSQLDVCIASEGLYRLVLHEICNGFHRSSPGKISGEEIEISASTLEKPYQFLEDFFAVCPKASTHLLNPRMPHSFFLVQGVRPKTSQFCS